MPSKRGSRQAAGRLQRQAAQASAHGECVFHALLAGLHGLRDFEHLRTHTKVLAAIRSKLRARPERLRRVRWNGAVLSPGEVSEFEVAVLRNIHVGDGYFCGACDPLLACYSAAFSVNIEHDFAGTSTTYQMPGATRTICMSSSTGHMEHDGNQDHEPDYSCGGQELPEDHFSEPSLTNEGSVHGSVLPAAASAPSDICRDSPARTSMLKARLQLHRTSDGTERMPYGHWVLVQPEEGESRIGLLRQAQGRAKGKLLDRDGEVVFFPWTGATVTAFTLQPANHEQQVRQVLLLAAYQAATAAVSSSSECCCCCGLRVGSPQLQELLARHDWLAASAASLCWWRTLYGSLCDITIDVCTAPPPK